MLLTSAGGTACRTPPYDYNASTPAPRGLTLTVLSISSDTKERIATIRLENESERPFTYKGGSLQQPVIATEYYLDVAWKPLSAPGCGYGMMAVTLPPHQAVTIAAPLWYEVHNQAFPRLRVGIRSIDGAFTVWSPLIDLAGRKWTSAGRSGT